MADRHDVNGKTESERNRAAGGRPEVRQSSKSAGSRPEVRQSSKSAGSRPEVRQSSKSAGSRPEVRQSSKSAGGRPEVRQSSKSAGNRQVGRPNGAGTGNRSANSRPKSATAVQKTRTSTGRPLEDKKTGTSVKRNVTQKKNVRKSSGSRNSSKKKKKSSNVVLNAKAVLIAAVVVGLILALIVTLIMRASMLRVRQIEENYNMGDLFDIKNYFEASGKDVVLEYDTADFAPDKLGTYKVKFTVRRGKMSKKKTGKINVVDEVKPYISGPDEIEVGIGEEINWSDYYTVTDEDPDIQSKLKSVNEIDTGKARAVSATLTVTDWGGNTSTKAITVMVTDSKAED